MHETGFQNHSVIVETTPTDEVGWLQKIDEGLNAGDPTVRQWFLVRQPLLPGLLCFSYVIFSTRLGPSLMKDRRPFDLRTTMTLFNFSIVIAYIICLAVVAIYLPQVGWESFCKGAVVLYGTPTYKLAYAAWVIYILKYIEYFDTVFFVLRKKQNLITVLHVFHHAIVPFVGWTMMRMENSGMQSIPVIINSIVHVIMYTYYGLAAMGPSVRKYLWWKKYLTQLQMLQFVAMFVFVILGAALTDCHIKTISYVTDILLFPAFLYLFHQYYKMAFKNKSE